MSPASRSDEIIASAANPTVKRIRSLQQRKHRLQERAFVVSGVRAVMDAIGAGAYPELVLATEDAMRGDLEAIPADVTTRYVRKSVFDQLTDVAHPQAILGVFPFLPDADLPPITANPLVVVVDAVRDPGNLGTIFRSAAAAGVDHILIAQESVDPYHPKVVRAAMGATWRIPFSARSWRDLGPFLAQIGRVAVADAGGSVIYDEVDWCEPAAIIVGGEAFGPSNEAIGLATDIVSIPMANGVESLNAGVAASLLMFEAARQRRAKT